MNRTLFRDRKEAGGALARRLLEIPLPSPVTVLALPRGGAAVAAPIARALHAPLDLVLVRKIGAPGHPELAVAAVAEGDPPQVVLDDTRPGGIGVDPCYIEAETRKALQEIERRRNIYLAGRERLDLAGRTVVVVDDGLATGSTMRAALAAVRHRRPGMLVLALPVAPREALDELRGLADRVVCLFQPEPFFSVGEHYADFHQAGDDEVLLALESADGKPAGVAP